MSLIKKIAKISAGLPSLKKGDENNNIGFSFVSIDEYYEKIARAVIEGGVFWTTSQGSSRVTYIDDLCVVDTNYTFNVYDVDGDEKLEISVSVAHPFQGAQTAGASLSYADKLLMRSLFKVVTGEPDADNLAKGDRRPRRERRQEPESVPAPASGRDNTETVSAESEAETIYKDLHAKFVAVVTAEDLADVLVKERRAANRLKSLDEGLYRKLQAFYGDFIMEMRVKEEKSNG